LLPAFDVPGDQNAFRRPSMQADYGVRGTLHATGDYFFTRTTSRRKEMARKYSKKASKDVERAMKKRKAGTLKSGRSGKKVKSRKQAIAIGLSEARAKGKKVPKKSSKKRKTGKKKTAKKSKR
jgi:Family of unknown function (DUF6496)